VPTVVCALLLAGNSRIKIGIATVFGTIEWKGMSVSAATTPVTCKDVREPHDGILESPRILESQVELAVFAALSNSNTRAYAD
jgi:hypothetical protein